MERTRGQFIYSICRIGLFFSLAIASILIRGIFIEHIRFFIGGLMIFYGIEQLTYEAIFHRKGFIHHGRNYLAFIELILGITVLAIDMEFVSVCIMWATWSILRESYEFQEVIVETKSKVLTVISGAESIAVIVLSIMLIATPTEHHALIHLFLLFIELILTPIVPFLDVIIEQHKEKKNGQSE